MIPKIDPIQVMMDTIVSETQLEIRVGYQTESIFHINIDPQEILRKLPRLLTLIAQQKAQFDGHHVISGERPDTVVIHFNGTQYVAKADYQEVQHNEFKGYKHD